MSCKNKAWKLNTQISTFKIYWSLTRIIFIPLPEKISGKWLCLNDQNYKMRAYYANHAICWINYATTWLDSIFFMGKFVPFVIIFSLLCGIISCNSTFIFILIWQDETVYWRSAMWFHTFCVCVCVWGGKEGLECEQSVMVHCLDLCQSAFYNTVWHIWSWYSFQTNFAVFLFLLWTMPKIGYCIS